ncbi:serine-type endopeptidase [Aureococcus anophagefferens]|nr:serine-type endopeptidase [Aureococcus anophagefferens]
MRPQLLLLALAPLVGGRRPRRLEKLASDYDSLVSAVAHDETTSTVRVKLADSATPVPLEHAVGGAPRRTFRPAGVHEARHVAAGLDRWWSFTFPDAALALEALEAMLDDELLESDITKCELAMKVKALAPPPGGAAAAAAAAAGAKPARPHPTAPTPAPEVSSDDGPGDPSATYEDPDDPYYDLYQKSVFESLRVPDAWALGAGRTDVVVQIIDTGSHHGVHCAGNVAASTNNGVGIAGVAGDGSVTIMTSVLFGNTATTGDAEALVYGADNGAHVSSNSWGWLGSTSFYGGAVQDAIDYATDLGVVVLAAAGNDDDDNWHWPARYDRVYAVAATDATGAKASFSNYGDWVDFAAPGESIVSLVNDGGYMSGTSMSTPLVAGIVAFGLSLTNDAALVNRTLVRKCLRDTALDVGDLNSREIGKYVQADGFVACVSDIDTPSSPPSTTPRPTALETAAPTDAFCTEFVLAGGDAYNDDKMGTYAVLPGEFCGGKHKYRCVDCAYELDLNAYYYSGYPLWAIGEGLRRPQRLVLASGAETPDLSTARAAPSLAPSGAPVAAPTTPRPSSTPKPTASYCTAFALSGGFSYNSGKLGTYRANGDFCDGRPVYACVDCAHELELTAFYYAGYPLWAIGEHGCGDLDVWFYSPSTAATPDLADGWYEETDATSQFAFNGDLALTCVSYDLGVPAPTGAPTPRPRPTPTTRPTSPAPEPAPTAIAAAPTAAAGYDPTCGGCDAGDEADDAACQDSSSWYSKKSKNGCDWASKKSKNCKKKDEFKVKALEACPATCGACGD